MTPWRSPWRLPASACLAVALASATLGCVTLEEHQRTLDERDRLRDENERLKLSNKSMDDDRARAISELEDLRLQKEQAEKELKSLARTSAEMQQELESREALVAQSRAVQSHYDPLLQDLGPETGAGKVRVQRMLEGIRVELAEELLFPAGAADLSAEGVKLLKRLAKQLQPLPDQVQVRGHTDGIPVQGKLAQRYPTNWDLGAARAARVVHVLEEAGVPGDRLVVVSFGKWRPIDSNSTQEGRAHNRRVELRLLPEPTDDAPAPPDAAAPPGGGEAPASGSTSDPR